MNLSNEASHPKLYNINFPSIHVSLLDYYVQEGWFFVSPLCNVEEMRLMPVLSCWSWRTKLLTVKLLFLRKSVTWIFLLCQFLYWISTPLRNKTDIQFYLSAMWRMCSQCQCKSYSEADDWSFLSYTVVSVQEGVILNFLLCLFYILHKYSLV